MSGVTTGTAVMIAAGVSAAASIASAALTKKPSTSTGASALKSIGSWTDDAASLGFDTLNIGAEDTDPPSQIDIDVAPEIQGEQPEQYDLSAPEQELTMDGGSMSAPAPEPQQGGGMLDFITKNQTLVGGALAGLGKGLGGYMTSESNERIADKKFQADKDLLSQKNDQLENKWAGTGPGMLNMGEATRTPGPTPSQKYDPAAYRGLYQWDPAQNKFVFVPSQPQA